jgi:hypothetical protein
MILVDELREYRFGPRGPGGNRLWCHLASDDLTVAGLEELHTFAKELGLKREWFQPHLRHPHYDLPPVGREAALRMGAQPVTSRELVRRLNAAREAVAVSPAE